MATNRNILTLDEFTIQEMRAFPQATGELASLLRDIGLAGKRINIEVNRAGLVDILGDDGSKRSTNGSIATRYFLRRNRQRRVG
jgi:fructose-1,6-bisphosphatase I